ncbi:predicted protein [Naegleria gruberi]|uniref:Predicted protein n=1 Tax=Naegleria gruberi TaxID=5762 RepID=D2VMS5_NAEGR|nr:uncharacterized protein NAEGRDRAFT_80575 [Naegleria gruberi]EFC41881.1 predicted protein [Naegleria gruberi]|eukprot:XP_002674625.1 predicted protein [Naegleria gruberi strain NEG-M]
MFGGNNEKDLEGELKNYGRQHSSPTVIKVATGLKKDFNTQGIGKEDSIHSSNYIQNDLDEAIYKYDIHPFSVFDKVPVQSSSSSNNNNNSASNNNSGANATTITFPPPPKDLSDPELDLFHTFFADARKKYHNKDSVFREQLELLTSGGKKKSEKEKIVARSSEQVDKEGWLVKEGRFRKNWKKRWFVLSSNTLSYYTAKKNKLKGKIVLDGTQIIRFAKSRTDDFKGCLELYTPKDSTFTSDGMNNRFLLQMDEESEASSGDAGDDDDDDDDAVGRTLYFDVEGGSEDERRSWYIAINNKITMLYYKNLCSGSINEQVTDFFNTIHKRKVFTCKLKQVEDLMAIKEPLKYHEFLHTLVLKNNPNVLNLSILCEALVTNKSITKLDISGCGLSNLEPLTQVLQSNKTLTSINLSHNNIDDKQVALLSEALPTSGMLRLLEIDLSYNKIGNEGCKTFVNALASLHSVFYVQTLNLHHNKISDEGAQAVASILEKLSPQLTCLDLGANQIGNEGATVLSDAIMKNNSKHKNIKSGTSELSKILEKELLDELIFGGNKLGVNGLQLFRKQDFPELEIISK